MKLFDKAKTCVISTPNRCEQIERETYDNNLFFYTILKALVQCRIPESKMIALQSCIHAQQENTYHDAEKFKVQLFNSDQIVKTCSDARGLYDNLVNMLDNDNIKMWLDMVDAGIELLLFKDLILQESKAYTLARQQLAESEIADHLSIEYDSINLSMPYGQRVLSSLLVFALTDVNRKSEFLLASSNRRVKVIDSKISKLTHSYLINCNNMLMLIVDESVNQSIKSTAGSSYEDRVESMIAPLVSDLQGHSHDSNISAMEYDFTFVLNGKRVGVSAKRTLRERYKQNHEDVDYLGVDYVLVFTLGTDLNKDKLNSLLQKNGTYVVVSREVYNMREYLRSSPNVLSSELFTRGDAGACLSSIIR